MVTVTDSADVFWFQWFRDRAGYAIKHGKRAADALLELAPIRPVSGELVPCGPLEASPDIARELAAVADTDAAIVAFTDRHGPLWKADSISVAEFKQARDRVRRVVELLDLDHEMDAKLWKSARHLKEEGDERWKNYYRGMALDPLARIFNEKDAASFSLQITMTPPPQRRKVLRVVPTSLLAAIWLVIGKEIAGELEWATCKNPECQKRFPTGPNGFRRRGSKCCSRECELALNALQKKDRAIEQLGPPKIRKCAYCGTRYRVKRESTDHCGRSACKQKSYYRRKAKKARRGRKP